MRASAQIVVRRSQVALLCCAIAEQAEHRRRSVDSVRLEMGCKGEQARQESSIAVSEDQRVASLEERRNVMEAATLQQRAEGEILHRAVQACDAVEPRRAVQAEIDAGRSGGAIIDCPKIRKAFQRCHAKTRKIGVSSAASAATRSASRNRVRPSGPEPRCDQRP